MWSRPLAKCRHLNHFCRARGDSVFSSARVLFRCADCSRVCVCVSLLVFIAFCTDTLEFKFIFIETEPNKIINNKKNEKQRRTNIGVNISGNRIEMHNFLAREQKCIECTIFILQTQPNAYVRCWLITAYRQRCVAPNRRKTEENSIICQ